METKTSRDSKPSASQLLEIVTHVVFVIPTHMAPPANLRPHFPQNSDPSGICAPHWGQVCPSLFAGADCPLLGESPRVRYPDASIPESPPSPMIVQNHH